MDKYLELWSLFRLKCVTENIQRVMRTHTRIKLDLFILVSSFEET